MVKLIVSKVGAYTVVTFIPCQGSDVFLGINNEFQIAFCNQICNILGIFIMTREIQYKIGFVYSIFKDSLINIIRMNSAAADCIELSCLWLTLSYLSIGENFTHQNFFMSD